jgi:hypothetical protein
MIDAQLSFQGARKREPGTSRRIVWIPGSTLRAALE